MVTVTITVMVIVAVMGLGQLAAVARRCKTRAETFAKKNGSDPTAVTHATSHS